MTHTRRSVLKSAAAGFMAAGATAAAMAQQAPAVPAPKAVVFMQGATIAPTPGQFLMDVTAEVQVEGGSVDVNAVFVGDSFNLDQTIASNLPSLLSQIQVYNPSVQAKDLLFIGFDFLRVAA